jgi:hypothetical protein
MEYKNIITIEPGKRGGKPCIRGMRITVYDVLEYLASGMSEEEILKDFPYLPEKFPRVEIVTSENKERLMKESAAFRKTVRGKAIGKLG